MTPPNRVFRYSWKNLPLLPSPSFTFIELLLVVILLGVLAGFIFPDFSKAYTRFKLTETAKELASCLRYAQNRAVIYKKTQEMQFNLLKGTYELQEAEREEAEPQFKAIKGSYGKMFSLPEGITLSANQPAIRFYPDGKIDKIRLYLDDHKGNHFTVSTKEQVGYVQMFYFEVE